MGTSYTAISDGTLSNPYRHVKQGEVLDLDEPVNFKWLVPTSEFKAAKNLPVTPYMADAKPIGQPNRTPPSYSDPMYDAQMEAVKANEIKADTAAGIITPPAPIPVPPEPVVPASDAARLADDGNPNTGTGNQEAF